MKKAIHLFLLIPVLLHSGGMIFLCMILQLNMQSRIEKILENPATRFEKLTISTETYKKNKLADNELLINGDIYDIRNVDYHNNYVELIAFNDTEEKGIISIIEIFFSAGIDRNIQFPVQVVKLMASVYTIPEQELLMAPPVPFSICGVAAVNFYHFHGLEILSPPPEA